LLERPSTNIGEKSHVNFITIRRPRVSIEVREQVTVGLDGNAGSHGNVLITTTTSAGGMSRRSEGDHANQNGQRAHNDYEWFANDATHANHALLLVL
jgi:hypothetical protein